VVGTAGGMADGTAAAWGEGVPYPRFSDGEMDRRLEAARGLMRRQGVDALLIGGGPGSADVFYLTNYRPHSPAWVFLPLSGEPVILHHFHNHNPCIRAMTRVRDVRWYGPHAPEALAACLREHDLGRGAVGVVGLQGAIPYGQFRALEDALPEVRFEDAGRAFRRLRWIRGEEEIEWLRRSARLTDMACEALERGIRPGLTELDLTLLMHEAFVAQDGRLTVPFMASTPMEAPERWVPWQFPTRRALRRGDVLITELTVEYWTYAAQIHRPFAVAAPPTPLYGRLFEAALECYERVLRVLRPGATSEEAVEAGSVIEERGFTSYDSLLHGEAGKDPELGTPSAVHPPEPCTFEENMVLVVQPNPVTRDLTAGLQLGAAVLVRPGGAECLHAYPFHFPVCGQ
jgi:Xaa-Pro dipeptidase